jgi:hypothetical protein
MQDGNVLPADGFGLQAILRDSPVPMSETCQLLSLRGVSCHGPWRKGLHQSETVEVYSYRTHYDESRGACVLRRDDAGPIKRSAAPYMLARSKGAAACETQEGHYIQEPTGAGFPRRHYYIGPIRSFQPEMFSSTYDRASECPDIGMRVALVQRCQGDAKTVLRRRKCVSLRRIRRSCRQEP